MASIFTYDPDPPQVSSPWPIPHDKAQQFSIGSPTFGLASDYGVTKLQAEPQRGPTEYKLHLLLRPRRIYTSMSTARRAVPQGQASLVETKPPRTPPGRMPAPSQTQLDRLKHLTTQLLWRLQQSSPYHASSSKKFILPTLSRTCLHIDEPVIMEPLVPGLEESRGALYEVGVSDDGTLIGLTEDEMEESVTTLRVMAASLGCTVDVVRMVVVGECEWAEATGYAGNSGSVPAYERKKGRLWVTEALVMPNNELRYGSRSRRGDSLGDFTGARACHISRFAAVPRPESSTTPQLRVTLIGPTTSGKSSLLGTLSTGTLDNGRGKSRLSLLKHRHEMVSGVTSSIAQELIGYDSYEIVNFSQGNIESWVDIHDCACRGRLVLVSDSGGHPRYRRTVLRGLLSWAPHWSILCVAADTGEVGTAEEITTSAQNAMGPPAASIGLIEGYLDLSLRLGTAMAIVITKLDLASKMSLRNTLARVLTSIKKAGRSPRIIQPDQRQYDAVKQVPPEDRIKVQAIVGRMAESGSLIADVPILLTSAVKGTGIGLVHALLSSLPVPPVLQIPEYSETSKETGQPSSIFHVDDTFSLPPTLLKPGLRTAEDGGIVVSGHVRFGTLSVGDTVILGPFQPAADQDVRGTDLASHASAARSYSLPPEHTWSDGSGRTAKKLAAMAGTTESWREARIVSIRNLRLPVRALEAGQAGSIGLVFRPDADQIQRSPIIRRGMVLALLPTHMIDAGLRPRAASRFKVEFRDPRMHVLTVGMLVHVYFASVRAAARVLHVSVQETSEMVKTDATSQPSSQTEKTDNRRRADARSEQGIGDVSLEFLHTREWIEVGSNVLLLESGQRDLSGLEGLVGRFVSLLD